MKIGIIGERYNFISYSMLSKALICKGIDVLWFVDATLPIKKKEELYGKKFYHGFFIEAIGGIISFLKKRDRKRLYDCKQLCISKNVLYILPKNNSVNSGLPQNMYLNPKVDYVLIAGCDQILNEKGLKLAKRDIINYHYSPLPAYRGKFVVFWQWYNKEPFIGYSFHKVDLGVDTGEVIYQSVVDYKLNESLNDVTKRVVAESSECLPHLFECLSKEEKVLITTPIKSSFYPAKKYLDLITINRSKTINDVLKVFQRTGYLRLKNGLVIKKIIEINKNHVENYSVVPEGIIVPLADGYLKVKVFNTRLDRILRFLIGKRRLLSGL